MPGVRIQITGIEKVLNRLTKAPEVIQESVERELPSVGQQGVAIWQKEVPKTYNKRTASGFGSSGQLKRSLYYTIRNGKIYFKMKPIYHTYHSSKYGYQEVTTEYGKFIRRGFKSSTMGGYDPCVDHKLWIHVVNPKTGQFGTHPGVSKRKYWDPMRYRIYNQLRRQALQAVRRGVSRAHV